MHPVSERMIKVKSQKERSQLCQKKGQISSAKKKKNQIKQKYEIEKN